MPLYKKICLRPSLTPRTTLQGTDCRDGSLFGHKTPALYTCMVR